MILARHLSPAAVLARIGHDRVARDGAQHFGELQPVGVRQEEIEDFRSADDGHGFISGEGQEVFFHSSALQGVRFDDLREGQKVTFTLGQGPKGPRAEDVTVVQ